MGYKVAFNMDPIVTNVTAYSFGISSNIFLQMLQGNLLFVRVISIAKLNLHAEMKKIQNRKSNRLREYLLSSKD